jgi:hypothetical protein
MALAVGSTSSQQSNLDGPPAIRYRGYVRARLNVRQTSIPRDDFAKTRDGFRLGAITDYDATEAIRRNCEEQNFFAILIRAHFLFGIVKIANDAPF